jgi:Tfp pilus assembly protein PilN
VSQVNLLPPEIRERQRIRRRTVLVGIIGGGVLLLVLAFYFLQSFNLARANEDLEAQQQRNGALTAQVSDLQEFGDLQAELADKRQLVAQVFEGEVAWSGVLVDVSRIMPQEAVLGTLTAQETLASSDEAAVAVPTEPVAGAAAPGELVGNMTFDVTAAGIDTVPSFLSRLEDVQGWANPYTTSLTETAPRSNDYTFQATVDLTKDALTARGRGEGVPT